MVFKSGLVALIGKPNVGKSTLVNALVGQRVSIVSDKPQTTRRRVIGFAQADNFQVGFVDTPGFHEPHTQLGKEMVAQARGALSDVDAVMVVVDASKNPDDADIALGSLVQTGLSSDAPILLCLNKMDLLRAEHVESRVVRYCELFRTDRYMLTTATKGHNVSKLMDLIVEVLPEESPHFPADSYTDQSSRFLAAELIREKVLVATRQEVPHATAVRIDSWDDSESGVLEIRATILVEKPTQRAILIGKQGRFIKQVGTSARADIEALLDRHVFLDLHVAVREDWRMNPRVLRELEYAD